MVRKVKIEKLFILLMIGIPLGLLDAKISTNSKSFTRVQQDINAVRANLREMNPSTVSVNDILQAFAKKGYVVVSKIGGASSIIGKDSWLNFRSSVLSEEKNGNAVLTGWFTSESFGMLCSSDIVKEERDLVVTPDDDATEAAALAASKTCIALFLGGQKNIKTEFDTVSTAFDKASNIIRSTTEGTLRFGAMEASKLFGKKKPFNTWYGAAEALENNSVAAYAKEFKDVFEGLKIIFEVPAVKVENQATPSEIFANVTALMEKNSYERVDSPERTKLKFWHDRDLNYAWNEGAFSPDTSLEDLKIAYAVLTLGYNEFQDWDAYGPYKAYGANRDDSFPAIKEWFKGLAPQVKDKKMLIVANEVLRVLRRTARRVGTKEDSLD